MRGCDYRFWYGESRLGFGRFICSSVFDVTYEADFLHNDMNLSGYR